MGLPWRLHEESAMDRRSEPTPINDLAGYHIEAHDDVTRTSTRYGS